MKLLYRFLQIWIFCSTFTQRCITTDKLKKYSFACGTWCLKVFWYGTIGLQAPSQPQLFGEGWQEEIFWGTKNIFGVATYVTMHIGK